MEKVAIIYPMGDYTAANLVYKLKALAEGKNIKIYTSSKNKKSEGKVISPEIKFKDVTHGILIAYDANEIDDFTRRELDFLCKKDIPVYIVVPHTVSISPCDNLFTIKKYTKGDINSFMKEIEDIKRSFEKKISKPTNRANINVFWVLIGLLLLLLLLDYLSKKGK